MAFALKLSERAGAHTFDSRPLDIGNHRKQAFIRGCAPVEHDSMGESQVDEEGCFPGPCESDAVDSFRSFPIIELYFLAITLP